MNQNQFRNAVPVQVRQPHARFLCGRTGKDSHNMGLVPVFPAEIHFRHQINGIFTRAMGAVGIEMHAANHAVGNIRIFRH